MTRRDAEAMVDDVVAACEQVEVLVDGVTLDSYIADLRTRRALERQLEIVGEAVGRVLRHAPEATATRTTDPRQVAGFRNRLAHEYDALDDAAVYGIAVRDVPALLEDLRAGSLSAGRRHR